MHYGLMYERVKYVMYVWCYTVITQSDTHRSTTLMFAPGQIYHQIVVEIIDDVIPELDEQFTVQLSEPTGGAVIGSQNLITIDLLTNDDAYGLIGFAEVSVCLFHSYIFVLYVC